MAGRSTVEFASSVIEQAQLAIKQSKERIAESKKIQKDCDELLDDIQREKRLNKTDPQRDEHQRRLFSRASRMGF